MQGDDSLHVIPAPLGKKRIPVSTRGCRASSPGFNGDLLMIHALPIKEGLQCLPTV